MYRAQHKHNAESPLGTPLTQPFALSQILEYVQQNIGKEARVKGYRVGLSEVEHLERWETGAEVEGFVELSNW